MLSGLGSWMSTDAHKKDAFAEALVRAKKEVMLSPVNDVSFFFSLSFLHALLSFFFFFAFNAFSLKKKK